MTWGFDAYDTQKLQEALRIIKAVYEYNFDSSRKSKLLGTVLCKLAVVIDEHGDKETLKRDGFTGA